MTASTPKLILPAVAESDDDHVSRFDVERYVCGELSPERRAVVARALAADPSLQALHDDMVADDKAFLISLPPASFMARLPLQKAPSLWARLLSWQAGLGVAAAAAGVVVIVALGTPVADDRVDGGTRTKGGNEPRVSFFVKEQSAARLGHAGEELKAGDQIQLAVKDVDKRALVLVGVDGAGSMSIYASESVQGGLSKGNGPPRVLPTSLVLDDTTGPERFFLVYGDDVEVLEHDVTAAAQRLADDVKRGRADLVHTEKLAVDAAYPQSSIHILKVR